MNKHANILAAIDNLVERLLEMASDAEKLKELLENPSIHARIEITEDERDALNNPDGEKPFSGSEY
jgi:hypothetical protein